MRRSITRACAVTAAGVTLSMAGAGGASAAATALGTVAGPAARMPRTATGSGTRLWVKRYNGPHGFAQATSVAANHRGTTVFVTGFSLGAGSEDYATIAYNATTGAQRWAKRYNDPGNGTDQAYAVAVNPNGSTVFVTGYSVENTSRYTTIAYNATTGAQLWVKQYNSGGQAHSVAVSPNGSTVFVTGFSIGATSGPDYATVAYNAATGAQLWVRKYDGPGNGIDQAQSVKVSPTGKEVFVTGFSAGARFYDYATVAYSATTGAQRWVRRYDGPAHGDPVTNPVVITVSPTTGTVFVTGTNHGNYATVAYRG